MSSKDFNASPLGFAAPFIAPTEGRCPPGKMYARMKSLSLAQYDAYRASGIVITWMLARPPGASASETARKYVGRCS